MVGAYLGAFAAVGTLFLVYCGHRYRNRFTVGNIRFHKNMVVGFFYIAVKKLHFIFIFQGMGKTGGHQGLTRSTFTTGNGYYHLMIRLTSYHLCSAFRAVYLVAGRPHLMGCSGSASRADAVTAGAGAGTVASHPAATTAASTYASPPAGSTTSGWSGSISSWHICASCKYYLLTFVSSSIPQYVAGFPPVALLMPVIGL